MATKKLPSLKRPTLDSLKRGLPSATPARNTGKGQGSGLMLQVPPETRHALKLKAAEHSTTVRALVLEALRKAGYPVPADELVDRRQGS